jgi:capsular exopolysaccharide synthesis family protein
MGIFRRKRRLGKEREGELPAPPNGGGRDGPTAPSLEHPGRAGNDRGAETPAPAPLLPVFNDDFEAEQFKALRTRLLFPSSGESLRSVGITSAAFGEGKTYVAAKLALSLAQNVDGKRALLIDADMRLPNLHHRFGFGDVPGLSEFLSGRQPLSSVLLKPFNRNLLLLPAGTPPPNPNELLSSSKMLNLLTEVHSRYDDRHIIIDLPSPKLVPESEVIARRMDGVIVVARAGKSPEDEVRDIIERIGRERVVGVVLNRFDTSLHSSVYRMYRRFIRRKTA